MLKNGMLHALMDNGNGGPVQKLIIATKELNMMERTSNRILGNIFDD